MAKHVAKTMDSVFANCTDSELDFDVMFDEDDSLIDLVAGFNEAGELITGPNPEDTYVMQLDEDGNDPISDEDDAARREGKINSDGNGPKEGSVKHADDKFNSHEGMKNMVPGAGSSAESHAHDLTEKIKNAIKEQEELATEVCESCGRPIKECNCNAVKESIMANLILNAVEEEAEYEEDDMVEEGVDDSLVENIVLNTLLAETDDIDKDASKDIKDDMKSEPSNSNTDRMILDKDGDKIDSQTEEVDVSSRTDDTFEAQLRKAHSKFESISDYDDADVRDGKEKYASSNVEAIKQKIIMAAQEQEEVDLIKNLIVAEGLTDEVVAGDNTGDTVPDKIQTNASANNIPKDVDTQSSEGLEPATEDVVYKGWLNNLTEAIDRSVENVADTEDIDDDLIDKVDSDPVGSDSLDVNVDYDDDQLIDMIIKGEM